MIMAFCRQCGTQIDDGVAFCTSCGAKIDENQNSSGQYQYNAQANQYQNYNPQANDVEENKLISILCYFGILFLIPYLVKPDSPFVKFHSNQGLVLLIASVALGVVSRIPYLGWLVGAVGGIFVFVCFIMGIINVCNGATKELPLIGKIQILK